MIRHAMAVKRDYYDVLGVPRDAHAAEVKRAFRRLAQQYHPDVDTGRGAEPRFKELNEAYEVLSDRQRRSTYDLFGHAGVEGSAAVGFEGFGGGLGPSATSSTRSSAGRRQGAPARRGRRQGRIFATTWAEFEEAVFGVEKEIEIPPLSTCATLRGQGVARERTLRPAPTATAPASSGAWRRRSWARW